VQQRFKPSLLLLLLLPRPLSVSSALTRAGYAH
jgi:hypothetical protein